MPSDGTGRAGQSESAEPGRSGEDSRRRGWFWHWNTIITQYAPLIGLKGVGLLNSYTVWTDRREESPHRGYAFPSQQAESAFYGEDRAELITINKILVALDLIEIRKEMVPRTDEQGRRWRVPHNLYRVKDHPNGYALTTEHVRQVVELAAHDRAVYRFVRRIFSPRFAPIDADNVWHQILPVVRETPAWQQLARRAAKEEERASARTKAGHRTRAGERETQQEDDTDRVAPALPRPATPGNDTTGVAPGNGGSALDVAGSNSGSAAAAAPGNDGSTAFRVGIAARTNQGGDDVVAPSNTTYYQRSSTTTTTTSGSTDPVSPPARDAAGPLPSAAPAVVACFEAANDREATPLERELLAELECAFNETAQCTGQTGAEWVVAAIREAVASGSRFVAPKRIREILTRWSTRATPSDAADRLRSGAPTPAEPVAAVDPVDLPHGQSAERTWDFVLRLLAASVSPAELEELFVASRIVGYRAGTVTVAVRSREAASRLSGEYYDLVARTLAEAMRRPVRVEFVAPDPSDAPPSGGDRPAAAHDLAPIADAPPEVPRFTLPGGLSNLQLWSVAQEVLATRLTRANWETWIRPAILLGIDGDGALVLGTPSAVAQRRVASRLLRDLEAVLAELLERPVRVRPVVTDEWLRDRAREQDAPNGGAPERRRYGEV